MSFQTLSKGTVAVLACMLAGCHGALDGPNGTLVSRSVAAVTTGTAALSSSSLVHTTSGTTTGTRTTPVRIFHPTPVIPTSSATGSKASTTVAKAGTGSTPTSTGQGMTIVNGPTASGTSPTTASPATASTPPGNAPILQHAGPIMDLGFSTDGKSLTSGGGDMVVSIWTVSTGQPVSQVSISPLLGADSLWILPQHQVVTEALADIEAFDTQTGAQIQASPPEPGISLREFSPDGSLFSAMPPVGSANGMGVYGTSPWALVEQPAAPAGSSVQSLAFSWDNAFSAGFSNNEIFIDDATGALVKTLPSAIAVTDGAFSPDGTLLAAWSFAGGIEVLDLASGSPVFSVPGAGTARAIFSPDSKTLAIRFAISSVDEQVTVADIASGQVLQCLDCSAQVTAFAYSPDDSTLATGDANGKIRLWDTLTGVEVTP